MKKILLFLSLLFLISCSEQKEISVEEIQDVSKESIENYSVEDMPNVFSLEDNNQLMFSNGDKINVYKENDFVVVELNKDNKNIIKTITK